MSCLACWALSGESSMTLRSWIRRHTTLHRVVHATWCRVVNAVSSAGVRRGVSSTGSTIVNPPPSPPPNPPPTPPPTAPPSPPTTPPPFNGSTPPPTSLFYIKTDATQGVGILLSADAAMQVFGVSSSSNLLALYEVGGFATAGIDSTATYLWFGYNVGSYGPYLTATDDDGNSLRYPR